jgi:Fibronectin type III domain
MMRPDHLVQSHRARISLLRWLICGMMLIASSVLQAAFVTLEWSPSTDPTVVGYKIYYWPAGGGVTNSIDVGDVTNVVVTNLADDTTYYFAATSYDGNDVESIFSNEIVVTTDRATIAPLLTQNVGVSGQFSFNVSGVPNDLYVVQASTDLINWVPVQTNTAPFSFVDTNAGLFRSRYYRVVNVSN